jgi:hypothetical protein
MNPTTRHPLPQHRTPQSLEAEVLGLLQVCRRKMCMQCSPLAHPGISFSLRGMSGETQVTGNTPRELLVKKREPAWPSRQGYNIGRLGT